MRIGIIGMALESSDDFRFAGIARYAFSLMDEIVRHGGNGHQYEFYLLPSFNPPAHWLSAEHVTIRRTWKRYNKWTLLVSGLVARAHKLDFLFSTSSSIPIFSGVPTGVFIHDLFPLDHPEWFPDDTASVNSRVIPRAVETSKIVFTNSESTKESICRHFQVPESKVRVTPLAGGNEISRLSDDQIDWAELEKLGIRTRRFILTLSTIEPRKNLGRVFEAMAELRDELEEGNIQLVVAGSKGWKYEAALAKIQELGLSDFVNLLGYVPDEILPSLFSACEFYLCASISEGFGMPLVEAMKAGCPIVSSNGGALPEVGGDAVRYFDPESVASITESLRQALSAPDQRDHWRELSLSRAEAFNWQRTADLTVREIENRAA